MALPTCLKNEPPLRIRLDRPADRLKRNRGLIGEKHRHGAAVVAVGQHEEEEDDGGGEAATGGAIVQKGEDAAGEDCEGDGE